LVLFKNALVLVHKIPTHFLKVPLVCFKLVNLFADWSLKTSAIARSVNLKLLVFFLLVLPVDIFEQTFGPSLEILVHIYILPLRVTDLFEAVHVKLANKGSKVPVLEVFG